jgi:hypothetical protein
MTLAIAGTPALCAEWRMQHEGGVHAGVRVQRQSNARAHRGAQSGGRAESTRRQECIEWQRKRNRAQQPPSSLTRVTGVWRVSGTRLSAWSITPALPPKRSDCDCYWVFSSRALPPPATSTYARNAHAGSRDYRTAHAPACRASFQDCAPSLAHIVASRWRSSADKTRSTGRPPCLARRASLWSRVCLFGWLFGWLVVYLL